jgi:hypothetical protein
LERFVEGRRKEWRENEERRRRESFAKLRERKNE